MKPVSSTCWMQTSSFFASEDITEILVVTGNQIWCSCRSHFCLFCCFRITLPLKSLAVHTFLTAQDIWMACITVWMHCVILPLLSTGYVSFVVCCVVCWFLFVFFSFVETDQNCLSVLTESCCLFVITDVIPDLWSECEFYVSIL